MRIFLLAAILLIATPALAQTSISDCIYTSAAREVARCLVDGKIMSIPVVSGNRHWDLIVSQQIPVADPE